MIFFVEFHPVDDSSSPSNMPEPEIRDVVLFEQYVDRHELPPYDTPINNRIDLAPSLYIERLPGEINRITKAACLCRGHNWDLKSVMPTLYAFVMDTEDPDKWDATQKLQTAVALSRICHPTSIGLEFSAKVFGAGVRQADYVVVPSLIGGHGSQAFIPDPSKRNWLTASDVAELPVLIENLPKAPERVARAFWFHEYCTRTEHVPVRFALAVTALEALVHVERFRSTRQFVAGIRGLASDCGVAFGEDVAAEVYDHRSRYAHGVSVRNEAIPLLTDVETLLRVALHRLLLDPSYSAMFDSDDSIRSRFPL
jgi:hypothetical protein